MRDPDDPLDETDGAFVKRKPAPTPRAPSPVNTEDLTGEGIWWLAEVPEQRPGGPFYIKDYGGGVSGWYTNDPHAARKWRTKAGCAAWCDNANDWLKSKVEARQHGFGLMPRAASPASEADSTEEPRCENCGGTRSGPHTVPHGYQEYPWCRSAFHHPPPVVLNPPASEPTAPRDSWWLVETLDSPPLYVSTRRQTAEEYALTPDPWFARRFDGKEDAEEFAGDQSRALGCEFRVVSHGFSEPPAAVCRHGDAVPCDDCRREPPAPALVHGYESADSPCASVGSPAGRVLKCAEPSCHTTGLTLKDEWRCVAHMPPAPDGEAVAKAMYEATFGNNGKWDDLPAFHRGAWVYHARKVIALLARPAPAGDEAVVDALALILPMAKGYAAEHPVGSNAKYVVEAEAALARSRSRGAK